jgi:hypothetical protein
MAAILASFNAKPVRWGLVTCRGQLHEKDVEQRDDYGNTVLRRMTVLHVAAALLVDAATGDNLTADGRTFRVHDNRLIAGGAIREILLATGA